MASHLTQNESRGLCILPWYTQPCVSHSHPRVIPGFAVRTFLLAQSSPTSRLSTLHRYTKHVWVSGPLLQYPAWVPFPLAPTLLMLCLSSDLFQKGLYSELCKQYPTYSPLLCSISLYTTCPIVLCISFNCWLSLEWRLCVIEWDKYLLSERRFNYRNVQRK